LAALCLFLPQAPVKPHKIRALWQDSGNEAPSPACALRSFLMASGRRVSYCILLHACSDSIFKPGINKWYASTARERQPRMPQHDSSESPTVPPRDVFMPAFWRHFTSRGHGLQRRLRDRRPQAPPCRCHRARLRLHLRVWYQPQHRGSAGCNSSSEAADTRHMLTISSLNACDSRRGQSLA
jgi:hypothetical protein